MLLMLVFLKLLSEQKHPAAHGFFFYFEWIHSSVVASHEKAFLYRQKKFLGSVRGFSSEIKGSHIAGSPSWYLAAALPIRERTVPDRLPRGLTRRQFHQLSHSLDIFWNEWSDRETKALPVSIHQFSFLMGIRCNFYQIFVYSVMQNKRSGI